MTGVSDAPTGRFVRPDLKRGQQADRGYADVYAASHAVDTDAMQYRAGYAPLLLADGLAKQGYRLLDVGCGTGGYHRLLTRASAIVGVDFSTEMIATAEQLRQEFGTAHAQYHACSFNDFQSSGPFDVVSMVGVYGWYLPWHGNEAVITRLAALLGEGGIGLVSYVPPRSLFDYAKAMFLPSRTVICQPAFLRGHLRRAGLRPMMELELPHCHVILVCKGGHGPDVRGEG